MKLVYAERARDDIGKIYDRIAGDSPTNAQRVEDKIRATCEGLADFPYASAPTDEPNVRRLPVVRYPYTIFFRVDPDRELVEITRVIHSARVKNLGQMPDAD
jgi:toxin ParE1/3/4